MDTVRGALSHAALLTRLSGKCVCKLRRWFLCIAFVISGLCVSPSSVATAEPGQEQAAQAGAPSTGVVPPPGADAASATAWNPADATKPIDGPPAPVPPHVINRGGDGRATIRASKLTAPLQLDGRLDEPVYETVEPLTGFVQSMPDWGQPISQHTEAWILFDQENVYVSARCWDTAPESQWVADEMRRDQNSNQDTFGISLDTYYDRQNGYIFTTNPITGRADYYVTNESDTNTDFNPVWDVRTGRFQGGWTVEMKIPFKSLRYGPGRFQVWGVQLRRVIRRRGEWSFLTPLPIAVAINGFTRFSTASTLVGVEAPPGSRIFEIKPYGISRVTTDRMATPALSNDLTGAFGFDAKYGVTPNVTLDFTYKTDVAQVEVDEQQVNLTRFNLFFPEKRDFFLENAGVFLFGSSFNGPSSDEAPQLFFSRRIGLNAGRVVSITAGARLISRTRRTTLGLLNIQTDREQVSMTEPTNFTVIRLRQDILRKSFVGLMFTRRSVSVLAPGSSNNAYGLDANFGFFQNVYFSGYYAKTDTPGEIGRQDSYRARFDYNGDRYGLAAEHLFVGNKFNPEVGFVRRSDQRRTFALVRFSPRPASIKAVRRFIWNGSIDYILDTSGRLTTRTQMVNFQTEFTNRDLFTVQANQDYDRLVQPFHIAPGVTIPSGGYDYRDLQVSYEFGQQHRLSGRFYAQHGSFYDGEQTSVGVAAARFSVTPRLSFEPTVSVNWVALPHGAFTTQLLGTRANLTFTPRMFFSGLIQYNSTTHRFGSNLRFRWEYTPGSELFVVYTDERDTTVPIRAPSALLNRVLTVKITRLVRF